jgi:hypothetical protein
MTEYYSVYTDTQSVSFTAFTSVFTGSVSSSVSTSSCGTFTYTLGVFSSTTAASISGIVSIDSTNKVVQV